MRVQDPAWFSTMDSDCGYGVPDGDEYPEFSNDSSCDQACVPGEYVLKPYSNRTGAFMASIVTSCRTYNPECGACRLTPLWVTAFPGSSFKSAVNVGACEGTCPETANACIAKNTKTVAVSGPNGVITVEQTLECGCEDKKCHREDYYESYWEVVEGIDRNGTVVKEKAQYPEGFKIQIIDFYLLRYGDTAMQSEVHVSRSNRAFLSPTRENGSVQGLRKARFERETWTYFALMYLHNGRGSYLDFEPLGVLCLVTSARSKAAAVASMPQLQLHQ
eukprot:Em0017g877a